MKTSTATNLKVLLTRGLLRTRMSLTLLCGTLAPGLAQSQSVLDLGYDPHIDVSTEGAVFTYVNVLATMPGKKMLVGGHFSDWGYGDKKAYLGGFGRFKEDGTGEDGYGFVPYPDAPAAGLKIGTIYVEGTATEIKIRSSSDISMYSAYVTADHGMIVTGDFNKIGGTTRGRVALLENSVGYSLYYKSPPKLEPSPGSQLYLIDLEIYHAPLDATIVNGALLLPTGEPMIYGDFGKIDGRDIRSVAIQAGADGSFKADSGWAPLLRDGNPGLSPTVWQVLRQNDGKFLISSSATTVNGAARTGLFRLNTDASTDSLFGYPGFPKAMVQQPDGKILVATSSVERLNLASGVVENVLVATDGDIASMVLRVDGSVVIGGRFTSVTGSNGSFTRNGAALISAAGQVSVDFDPDVEASDYSGDPLPTPIVNAIAIQEDGKVVIGGEFSKVSGIGRKCIARVTPEIAAFDDLNLNLDRTELTWTRQGSAPELMYAKFQFSTDGGASYTDLAPAAYLPGTGWQVTGLTLPTTSKLVLRATGQSMSGFANRSSGLVEKVLKGIATFTDQPDPLTVNEGQPASFSVEARSSLAIISYQWRRNGVNLVDGPNISGATTPTLNLTAAMAADGGTYTVVVKTSAGSATSKGALLKVIVPPLVITNPIDLVVGKGKPVMFTAKFSGTEPEYQWTGPFPLNAAGQESLTLSFSNAQDVHEGTYTITATNSAGAATTLPVTLTVVDPPAVAVTNNVMAGLGTAPVLSATVTAEAPSSLKYQWLKVTSAVSGATSATYTMTNIQLSQAGAYSLRATNPAGTVTGARGEVAVVDNVNEKTQVQKETGTAIFTAAAAGNGLTYVWKFKSLVGGVTFDPITLGARHIVSAGGKTLTVKGLALADAGDYIAEVTNVAGMLATAPERLFVTTGLPVLVGPMTFTENAMVNAPFSFQVDDGMNDNAKPASYKMTISPALSGLTISKTGLISGRPQKAGTFTITVTGTNAHGTSVAITGTLTVEPIPTNAIGKFVAIVGRNATTNANLGGRVDLTVTPVGSYSGKLFMGALSYSFSGGKLNVNAAGDTNIGTIDNPTNVITVARKGTTPLTLSFDLDLGNNTIAGTVTDGANSADLDGWRLVWSKTVPVQASDYLGRFNFTYLAPAEAPAQTYPHGYGFGSALIPAAGTVTVSGVLADGSAFSTASFVGPQGQLAVFKTLYSNTGSILGTHQIASGTGTVTDYAMPAAFSWLKKDQAPKVVYSYGAGFGPIDLAVAGSRYDPLLITSAVNVLGSDVATADTKLDFSDAGLDVATTNPDVTFTLNAANKAVFTSNLGKVKLTVTKSTGRFTGTYSIVDDIDGSPVVKNVPRTGNFSGVVVRNTAGTTGEGRGYHILSELPILPTTSTAKTQILSGPVVLSDVTP